MESDIITRLQKVIKLARGAGTEGEAAAAMARAHEMLTRHKLTMAQVEAYEEGAEAGVEEGFVGEAKHAKQGYYRNVLGALGRYYFCKVLIVHNNHVKPKKCGPNCLLHFIGRTEHVAVARSMGQYIIKSMDRIVRAEQERRFQAGIRGEGVQYIKSFRLGMAQRLVERIKAMHTAAAEGTVKTDDGETLPALADTYATAFAGIEKWIVEKYEKVVRSRKSFGIARDTAGFNAGRGAADGLSLNTQVGHGPLPKSHQLTAQ